MNLLVALVALVVLAGGCRRRSVEMVQLISNTGSKQQAASKAGFIADQQASVIRHQSSGIGHQASVIAHAGQ
jgi:hypothetical protein